MTSNDDLIDDLIDDLMKALLIALKLLEKRIDVEKLEEKYNTLNREVGNLYRELEELKECGVSNEPKQINNNHTFFESRQ